MVPLDKQCRPSLHGGVMSDTIVEQRPANSKADQWAERIAAQQRVGISVKQFCKEQGLTEYSFYAWRKRLQQTGPVRFALVDRPREADSGTERELMAALERIAFNNDPEAIAAAHAEVLASLDRDAIQ